MGGLGEWIKRKRFATAGHIGMLEGRLKDISGLLQETQQSVAETQQSVAETQQSVAETQQSVAEIQQSVAEIQQSVADTREAAQYIRRSVELGTITTGPPIQTGWVGRKTPEEWFDAHYWEAADHVLSFLAASELGIGGLEVADIGSGDGIIDLGLAIRGEPARFVGYDISPTDPDHLAHIAKAAGIDTLPANLRFVESTIDSIPAADESFDAVVTWSVFEHVSEPLAMLKEIRRILRPTGYLMLQLWPFYYSDHGGHLWLSHGGGFPHLLTPDDELVTSLKGKTGTDERRPADDEYLSLNRLTLNELGELMLSAGLKVVRAELMSETVNIPRELTDTPLADQLISGVKLLAVPSQP